MSTQLPSPDSSPVTRTFRSHVPFTRTIPYRYVRKGEHDRKRSTVCALRIRSTAALSSPSFLRVARHPEMPSSELRHLVESRAEQATRVGGIRRGHCVPLTFFSLLTLGTIVAISFYDRAESGVPQEPPADPNDARAPEALPVCGDGRCDYDYFTSPETMETCMADCPGVTTPAECGEEPHSSMLRGVRRACSRPQASQEAMQQLGLLPRAAILLVLGYGQLPQLRRVLAQASVGSRTSALRPARQVHSRVSSQARKRAQDWPHAQRRAAQPVGAHARSLDWGRHASQGRLVGEVGDWTQRHAIFHG